jgi:hypothetical protein
MSRGLAPALRRGLVIAAFVAAAVAPVRELCAKDSAVNQDDAGAVIARVDQLVAARWAAAKIQPAARAEDAEFLRRTYLDLVGRIPSVQETRKFLDDRSPRKRQQLIERLLKNPGCARHFGQVWRAWFLPETNGQSDALAPALEPWLRRRLRENLGYDQLVRELLTASAATPMTRRSGSSQRAPQQGTPPVFYQVNENKPENLAGSAARLFLGLRLECAQCHDHPAGRWSREQFWQFAAFFGNGRSIRVPGADRSVAARFPDATEPDWEKARDARTLLADWTTSAQNPFFARAVVNRLWAYFFGIGLVEPVDDLSDQNPASHPELLDELARQFAAHGFDLQFLIRVITSSQAYQLSSAAPNDSAVDPRLFGRMAVKGLSPEQLVDSLAQALGSPNADRLKAEFLLRFRGAAEKRTEAQVSILQALSLMNGKLIADATSLDRSDTLAAVADAPFLTPAERIEVLFLATLSRKPAAGELAPLVDYITKGGPQRNPGRALADVFWALLNSGEFLLNH